jgi:ABC-type sugar transport system substrate-binding protein
MVHWRLPAVFVSIAMLVAACGGSSSTSGGGSATAGKKITFVTALIADANWASVNTCFTDHAKQLGMVPTLIAPPNETASNPGMVSLTEQALITKPDGLVVVPLVAAAFDTVLDNAKSQKVPVVSIILDTSRPDQRIALVYTDPASYGTQGADIVGEAAKGKGNIGILYSGPSVTNQVTAIDAFKKEIAAKYPNMKIVDPGEIISPGGNRSPSSAAQYARGMLVAHPEINVIYSPDGLGGIAGALAARDIGKKPGDIIIVGSDHLPAVKADLQEGWETASLQFVSCKLGTAIVDAFASYFNKTLTSDKVNIPSVVWTHDNP